MGGEEQRQAPLKGFEGKDCHQNDSQVRVHSLRARHHPLEGGFGGEGRGKETKRNKRSRKIGNIFFYFF